MHKKKITAVKEKHKDQYEKLYLESQQNFMTVQGFMDWYGISRTAARKILSIGAAVHKERTGNDVDAVDKVYLSEDQF